MAIERHERISTFVTGTTKTGSTVSVFSLLDEHDKSAKHLVEQGYTDVAIVTERVTWRGKNGKRTREEIERITF